MKTFPLPLGSYESDSATKLQTILETTDDSHCGFFVECDLEYPDDLHDNHKDFPLTPTKKCVLPFWFRENQFKILHVINLKWNFKVKKDCGLCTPRSDKHFIVLPGNFMFHWA